MGTDWLCNEKGLTVEPGQLGGSCWARDWPCEVKARARAGVRARARVAGKGQLCRQCWQHSGDL